VPVSPTGRTVALLAAVALAALAVPVPLALAGVALVLVGFVVDAAWVRRPPVVERRVRTEVVRGVPVRFEVVVAPRPAVRVAVRQPQTADLRVTPAEHADGIEGELVATARGVHRLEPVAVRSTGPLGLGRWLHRAAGAVDVTSHADLPGARRIAAAVRAGTFRDPGLRRGPLGLGTDFESVRDYTPDDDIRHLNWRATERTGRAMVNQYREDTERDLWCLVDAGRLLASPVGDRTRLDAALDALAAVAAVADAVGDRVGAVVFDGEVRRVVRPQRANAAALTHLLDDLQPHLVDSDYQAGFARVASAKRSLVIVFTDLLDAAAARPLLAAVPVLVRRHAVLVAGTNDPDLVEAVTRPPSSRRALLEAGVATEILAERDQVRSRLAGVGAVVVDAPVERLATRCVSAYLQLKSTARI
jgi:uncharacterized protein (DUF58 family)